MPDSRTLTYKLVGKAEGKEDLRLMADELRGIQAVLQTLKKDASGASALQSAAAAAREQARVARSEADAVAAAARQYTGEIKAQRAAQEALTASVRATGVAAQLTARLSMAGQRDVERAVAQTTAALTRQREQLQQIGNLGKGATGKPLVLKTRLDTTDVLAELRKLQTRANSKLDLKVKLSGIDAAMNDAKALKAVLDSIRVNSQYRVTVNTTALTAVNDQIKVQIVQLQSLITQLRSLGGGGGNRGGGGGGGGGGGSGSGGLPANVQNTLREIERLNNLWSRGQINAGNYEMALRAMQSRLQGSIGTFQRGSAEFARIDAGITTITRSLRGINTDALARVRAEAAAMRLAFDQATAGVRRGSAEYRAAMATYQSASAGLNTRLQELVRSGQLTTQQLRAVNGEIARLARESNTIRGGVNHAGLSGNMANALGQGSGAVLQQSGGALGSTLANGAALGIMLKNLGQTAGPAALALGGVGVAAGGVAVAMMNLGSTGLGELKKFQGGMNILQANGVKDLKAVEQGVVDLQKSLGITGQALSRGDLTSASAEIVKAGVSVEDSLKLMASSSRLAAAENTNLNESSDLLLKNLRQYDLDMGQAAKVGDMLAKSSNLAAGTAYDLSTGLGIVGGTGKQAKIEMSDLLGMLVELDNKGMSAADVGANGLRSAIASLSDITEKGKGILHELGIEIENADGTARPAGDIMKDLGEKMRGMGITVDKATGTLSGNGEALRTVASIMDNRAAAAVINLGGQWKDYGQQIRDSDGELVRYSDTLQQGVDPAVRRLQTAWKDSGLEFAKSFAGPLADFLTDTLTPMVTQFGDWLAKLEKLDGFNGKEFKNTLKIEASDDATQQLLKLLGGGAVFLGQVGGEAGKRVGGMADANQKQWDDLVAKYTAAQVGQELIKAGLLPKPSNPVAGYRLAQQIEADLPKYQKLLADHLAKTAESNKVLGGLVAHGGTVVDTFFKAIVKQESRGDYKAFNTNFAKGGGQGAVGLAQIMPFNFVSPEQYKLAQSQRGAWARNNMDLRGPKGWGWDFEATGKDYTIRELLNDPAAQDKIIAHQLGRYLEQELKASGGDVQAAVKAAAAKWYGPGTAAGGPTTAQYSESVWNHFKDMAGTGTPMKASAATGSYETVAPGEFDPKIWVRDAIDPGQWSTEFISRLTQAFQNDPRVDSDCAIIAAQVMGTLGVKLKGEANKRINAGDLAQQVKASGAQQVNARQLKPGDYVDFSGPNFGATSGHHAGIFVGYDAQGNLMILNNHGGKKGPSNPNGKDVPTTVDTFSAKDLAALRQGGNQVSFYRPKESPYNKNGAYQVSTISNTERYAAEGDTPVAATTANEKLQAKINEGHHLIRQYALAMASGSELWLTKANAAVNAFRKNNKNAWGGVLEKEFAEVKKGLQGAGNVTSAHIAQARGLLSKVEATRKAAQAKPGDNRLAADYAAATTALNKWTQANVTNAAAMRAAQDLQKKGKGGGAGDVIPSKKQLDEFGPAALGLYKKLEQARESGVTSAVTAAQAEIKAWQGASAVRKAVFDAEAAAYQTRQRVRDQAGRDEETAATNRQRLERDISKAVGSDRIDAARRGLAELKKMQQQQLEDAGEDAQKRAAIIKKSGPGIIAAETQIARRVREMAVKEAGDWATDQLRNKGADPKKIEAERVRRVREAYRAEREAVDDAQAEQRLAEQRAGQALDKQSAQRAQERLQLRKQLDQQLAAGQITLAQATVDKLQQQLDTELAAYKNNAAERLRVEQELGPRVLAARKRVLEAERDRDVQKARADANAQRAALTTKYGKGKEPADLLRDIARTEQQAVDTAESTFSTKLSGLYLAQQERINSATAAVQAKNKQLGEQRVQIEKQVTQQLAQQSAAQRQGTIQAARDTLAGLEQQQRDRVTAAKGDAAQLLRIEQDLGGQIRAQRERVAVAVREDARKSAQEAYTRAIQEIPKGATKGQIEKLTNAANAVRQEALAAADRVYSLSVSQAGSDASSSLQQAREQAQQQAQALLRLAQQNAQDLRSANLEGIQARLKDAQEARSRELTEAGDNVHEQLRIETERGAQILALRRKEAALIRDRDAAQARTEAANKKADNAATKGLTGQALLNANASVDKALGIRLNTIRQTYTTAVTGFQADALHQLETLTGNVTSAENDAFNAMADARDKGIDEVVTTTEALFNSGGDYEQQAQSRATAISQVAAAIREITGLRPEQATLDDLEDISVIYDRLIASGVDLEGLDLTNLDKLTQTLSGMRSRDRDYFPVEQLKAFVELLERAGASAQDIQAVLAPDIRPENRDVFTEGTLALNLSAANPDRMDRLMQVDEALQKLPLDRMPAFKALQQRIQTAIAGMVDVSLEAAFQQALGELNGQLSDLDAGKEQMDPQAYLDQRAALLAQIEELQWEHDKTRMQNEGRTSEEIETARQEHERRLTNITRDQTRETTQLRLEAERAAQEALTNLELQGLEHRKAMRLIGERDYIVQRAALLRRQANETRDAALKAAGGNTTKQKDAWTTWRSSTTQIDNDEQAGTALYDLTSARAVQDTLAGIQMDGLERRKTQGLVGERQYIDERQRLQLEAARRTLQRVKDDHGDVAAAEVQFQQEVLRIMGEGYRDREALRARLEDEGRTRNRSAQGRELERQRRGGFLSEGDYLEGQKQVKVQEAGDNFLSRTRNMAIGSEEYVNEQRNLQTQLDQIAFDSETARQDMILRIQDEGRARQHQRAMDDLEFNKQMGLVSEREYIDQRQQLQDQAASDEFTQRTRFMKIGSAEYLLEQQRLLDTQTGNSRAAEIARQQLTWKIQDETLAVTNKTTSDALEFKHRRGLISETVYQQQLQAQAIKAARDEFAQRTRGMKEGSDEYKAAEAKLQADLTAIAQKGVEDRVDLEQKRLNARADVADAPTKIGSMVGLSPAQFDAQWNQQAEQMKVVAGLYPEQAAGIQKVIDKAKVFKGLNMVNYYAAIGKSIAEAGQAIAGVFGQDEIAQGLGEIAGGLEDAGKATQDWARVAAGDMTALPGAIMNSVTALDKFLAGMQALNPAYRQWKKNQLEIATLSREGMGQKKYGNWLENPYYDVLKEDADNREKLANARPLQKLGWWLFGGAPQVMSDEAAKAKSKAGVIFNDFASGLSQVLEQSLIDAAESGKYEDVGKAVNKWMRGYVRQMTLQAILAKSNLKALIEKLADDVANGADITNDQAAIEAEVGKITDQWKTVATKLEDEAKSIFEGLGDDIGSSVEDALMAAWEDGDWSAAEDKLQAKLNRFVASMALRALMATSKMKELVDAYIKEYEAGGDTTDELAAINSEVGRLTTQWQGMAPGLPGYGAGQKAPAENPQDTRRRNETLWQYENATDPAEKEKYRKELLGMDGKSGSGSGGPVAVVTREAAGPDWGALTSGIKGLSDRFGVFDQAAQLHMKAAERQMEAANIQLQAAGLLALAAQAMGTRPPVRGPGFINF